MNGRVPSLVFGTQSDITHLTGRRSVSVLESKRPDRLQSDLPRLRVSHTVAVVSTVASATSGHTPRPSARRAAGRDPERRSTAHPRPRETRAVAARQGARGYAVKADLGAPLERAEANPTTVRRMKHRSPATGGVCLTHPLSRLRIGGFSTAEVAE